MRQIDQHPKRRENIFWQFFILVELGPFLYYFVITQTLNLNKEEYILVFLDQYSSRRTSRSLWDNNIHTPQDGSKILWQFPIFMELQSLSYYFVITQTLNLSNKKWILVQLEEQLTIKTSKAILKNNIHTPQYVRKILWCFFISTELEPFFYYL